MLGQTSAYLSPMPVLPPASKPSAALADLKAFLSNRDRDRWLGGVLALLITAIIMVIFFLDASVNTAPPPRIIYTDSWSANRTDAEIVAQQKKDQAAREAAARERQRQFKELQDKLGID